MRRLLASLSPRVLGFRTRLAANVRGDLADLERALASVDAIATRWLPALAYGYAA